MRTVEQAVMFSPLARMVQNRKVFLHALALFVLFAATSNMKSATRKANTAVAVFRKLQHLAGQWEGKDASGNAIKSQFKLIANKTAVFETLSMSQSEQMVTIYSVDGDSISLMHYCPVGNQPHLRARPASADAKTLVFRFEGASNLPSLAMGHERRLVLQFVDDDHIIERWTWSKGGKDTEFVYDLARKR